VERLVKNYGSAYSEVLRYAQGKGRNTGEIPGDLAVMKAEAIYAVREEMAFKLGDVIFRRTETGSAGYPGEPALITFASVMRQELGWDQKKEQQEIDEVGKIFSRANGSASWQT
jgi:glycerol-3-phosphate dehydrogenase